MKTKKILSGVLFGVFITFIYLIGINVIGEIIKETNDQKLFMNYGARIIFRIALFVISALVIKKKLNIKFGCNSKNIILGVFWYGLCFIVIYTLNIHDEFMKPEIGLIKALPKVFMIFFETMSIGLIEETLFRGIFFNSFKARFGESKSGITKAALISSGMFGALHLLNLTGNPKIVLATFSQVLYATFFGFIFCVIYYRTKNFWSVVIIHGLVDFTGNFWGAFAKNTSKVLSNASKSDYTISYSIFVVSIALLFLISGILQLNKHYKNKQFSIINN